MTNPALLTENLERTYLKTLHRRYVNDFGHLTHRLPDRLFYTTERPQEIAIPLPDGATWYPVVELAQSLEKKGYIQFNASKTAFSLSEAGYRKAEENQWGRALSWLNSNQGVIAAIALIVSIVALFRSTS